MSYPSNPTPISSIEQQTQISVVGIESIIFEAGGHWSTDRDLYDRQVSTLDLDPIEADSDRDRVCGRCGSGADRLRSDPRWIEACDQCHEELIEEHGEPEIVTDGGTRTRPPTNTFDPIEADSDRDRVCGRCGSGADRLRSDPRWIEACDQCHEELIEEHGEPEIVTDGGTRTRPPTNTFDPIERYAGRVDQHVEADAEPSIEPCGECGSTHLDGWMDEGAVTFWTVCVECGAERKEEVDQ